MARNSNHSDASLASPAPNEIRAAREAAGLSQSKAAAVVGSKSYQRWYEWETGRRNMPIAKFELFLLKTK
jgi:DNA-binding transcriptional regulator YiaG